MRNVAQLKLTGGGSAASAALVRVEVSGGGMSRMPFVALRWLEDGMDLTDEAEEAGGLKARMGLAKAQPQPL